MPYEKYRSGDRFCVRKRGETKAMACYEGKGANEKADKYLAALEINAKSLENGWHGVIDVQSIRVPGDSTVNTGELAKAKIPAGFKSDGQVFHDVENGQLMYAFDQRPSSDFEHLTTFEMDGVKVTGGVLKAEFGAKMAKLTQAETQYVSVSPEIASGKACAACRWYKPGSGNAYDYDDMLDSCHLVECWPNPIENTGLCNRYEAKGEIQPYTYPPAPVYLVPNPLDSSEGEAMKTISRAGLAVVTALKTLFSKSTPMTTSYGFRVLDNGMWISWWTNNAEDKHKQLFSMRSIDYYIKMVNSGQWEMPALWYCHTPGTMHGKAKILGRSDNAVYAVGDFVESSIPGLTSKMKAWYKANPQGLDASHGFKFYEDLVINDVYYWFYTFEISSLPSGWAANPYASFKEMSKMALQQYQMDALRAVGLTDEEIKQVGAEADAISQRIAGDGVRTKDMGIPVPVNPGLQAVLDGQKAAQEAALNGLRTEINQKFDTLQNTLNQFLSLSPKAASKDGSTEVLATHPQVAALTRLNDKGAGSAEDGIPASETEAEGIPNEDALARFFPNFR